MKFGPKFLAAVGLLALAAAPAAAQDRGEAMRQCRAHLREAVAAFEAARYDSVLGALDRVLECDPANADAFYWRGRVFLARADTVRALETLTAGTAAAPLSSRLKLLLARVLFTKGKPAEASEHIDAVLAVKPREPEALYLRGLVRLAQGDTASALSDWTRSLESVLREKRR